MLTGSLTRATPLLLALSGVPIALLAQAPVAPPATPVTVDSSPAAAVLHGRLAAERRSMGGRFAGGFASGLFLAFFGMGMTYVIAGSDDACPPVWDAPQLATTSPTYELAFRQGYAERLKSRRRSSALKGGILGTLAVVVLVVASASNNN